MIFITRKGEAIDPLCLTDINAAKSIAPGEGIGPAVSKELITRIASGEISDADQLPQEYKQLAIVCGLLKDWAIDGDRC